MGVTVRGALGQGKNRNHERKDKGADGTVPVEKLQSQVGDRQQPSEQRKRAVEIVVGNRVRQAAAFDEGQIVEGQPGDEHQGAQLPKEAPRRGQKGDIARQTGAIAEDRKKNQVCRHRQG